MLICIIRGLSGVITPDFWPIACMADKRAVRFTAQKSRNSTGRELLHNSLSSHSLRISMRILIFLRYFAWQSLENVCNPIFTSWFVWNPWFFCRFSCSALLVDKLWTDPFVSRNCEREEHLDVQKYNCVICSLFLFCFSVSLLVSFNLTVICLVLLSWHDLIIQLTIDCCIDLDSFFDEPAMLSDMFTAWSDTAFVLVVMSTGMCFDLWAVNIIFPSEYYDYFS